MTPKTSGIDPARDRLEALEEDTSSVESTVEAFQKALESGDTRALAVLFTDRAEVYLQDGQARTVQEYMADLSGRISGWSHIRSELRIRGVKLARPYGWAKLTHDLNYHKDGRSHHSRQLVTMAFERRQGRWLIDHLQIAGQDLSAD